jgi:5,10-methylenetetrahydromethanopterin reductase
MPTPADPLELWCAVNGFPGTSARDAERAELEGWDGMGVPDSQNLTGDPYIALALAANASSRLLLAPWVSNPVTRHPALTAASIHTLQVESGGRAILGIGRGDSSVTHLGFAPAPVEAFAHYIDRVQAYLRGEEVPFELDRDSEGVLAGADTLNMAAAPAGSQLRWIRHTSVAKVPVDGAASGPKVIAACAVRCERITFAVGASPERVEWAVGIAKQARRDAGLDPEALKLGAMFHVGVHPDRATAIESIKGSLGSTARFSVMHGKVVGPVSDEVREGLLAVHRAYDFNKHSRRGAHTVALTDAVIDTFAVAGTVEHCVSRIAELRALGITRFQILASDWRGLDPQLKAYSVRTMAEEVLPGIREASANQASAPA